MNGRNLLTLPPRPDLEAEVAARVVTIPRGRLTTFGDLARSLGDRHAAIWVARSLAEHRHTDRCHCHRVLRVTGEVQLGSPAARDQLARLQREGVIPVSTGGDGATARLDLSDPFVDFAGNPPLNPLLDWLDLAARTMRDEPLSSAPRTVAGLDVAYRDSDVAIAAGVVLDVRSRSILWSSRIETTVDFPYIPGYLAFRELPALLEIRAVMQAAGHVPDVTFIDGQGRLHPRRAGIATAFAAVTGAPTIGVGKSLLCGRVQKSSSTTEPADVLDGGERIGVALRNRAASKPIYVSVGGYITLEEAIDLTRHFFRTFRIPLPTHLADRLSKRSAP